MGWIVLAVVLALLLAYVLKGREWLKSKPWAQGFFKKIDPLERWLYRKSETLLFGRLLWVGGLIVSAHDVLAVALPTMDLSPVTNRLLADVPEDLRGVVISSVLFVIGLVVNWLRKRTTKPIEVVALPETIPPEVERAVAKVETANAIAVAAVENAKEQGAV